MGELPPRRICLGGEDGLIFASQARDPRGGVSQPMFGRGCYEEVLRGCYAEQKKKGGVFFEWCARGKIQTAGLRLERGCFLPQARLVTKLAVDLILCGYLTRDIGSFLVFTLWGSG